MSTAAASAAAFWDWAARVPVPSRDQGWGPITPWQTQRRLIDELVAAAAGEQRELVVLKAGQVGASIATQLWTLYWMQQWPGLQGVCATDSDDTRVWFRDTLVQMARAAAGEAFRTNNRFMLTWPNGSRLLFQTAGPRSGARLGVGRGVAFIHDTECGLWTSGAALVYLRTRFSDSHPGRLAVHESTARGKNWWFDLWREAQRAKGMRPVFLAWWMRDDYRLEAGSERFQQYWTGSLRPEERAWVREVKRRWGVTLDDGQLAWRRWYEAEKCLGQADLAAQEMPTLPEEAFQATWSGFATPAMREAAVRAIRTAPRAQGYRYEFGPTLEETQCRPTHRGRAELVVWEPPAQGQMVIVAAVPAYATFQGVPDWVVSAWIADRRGIRQAAEFVSDAVSIRPAAWVVAQLAGGYRARTVILDLQGLGEGLLKELRQLRDIGWGTSRMAPLTDVLGGVAQYVWRRPDTLSAGGVLQWKSSPQLSSWLFARLRDALESGQLIPREPAFLEELDRLRREQDGVRPDGLRPGGHRVAAAALALESYSTQIAPWLRSAREPDTVTTVTERVIHRFFADLKERAHAAAAR